MFVIVIYVRQMTCCLIHHLTKATDLPRANPLTFRVQSDSSESDRCVVIGILHQPVEYPVVAVATRHFDVPDDGRVCAIILGSNNIDGTSRWCTESRSQVISLKGLLPGAWTVRIETVDWCV